MTRSAVLTLGLLLPLSVAVAQDNPTGSPEDAASRRAARIAWWREARFGMFLHWGPVSLTGLEISWSRANSNPKCPIDL